MGSEFPSNGLQIAFNFSVLKEKIREVEKNTTGIAVCLDEIRCLLNKITENSYKEIEEKIFKKIEDAKDNFKYEEFMKIGKLIFEIGSLNKYCSALYAKLYKNLISHYEVFTDMLHLF